MKMTRPEASPPTDVRRLCVSGSAHLLVRGESRGEPGNPSSGDVLLEIGGSACNIARELADRMQVEFFGGFTGSAVSKLVMSTLTKAGVSMHAQIDKDWPEAAISAHYRGGTLLGAMASTTVEQCRFNEDVSKAFLRESDALLIDCDLSEESVHNWSEWAFAEGVPLYAKSVCHEKAVRLRSLAHPAAAVFLSEGDLRELRSAIRKVPTTTQGIIERLGSPLVVWGSEKAMLYPVQGAPVYLGPTLRRWSEEEEDIFCARTLEAHVEGIDLEAACKQALASMEGEIGLASKRRDEISGMLESYDERASRDAMTGLPNRGWGEERLKEIVARFEEGNGPAGLAIFDIDHFKQVNDTWGHPAGDEVIRMVAAAAASAIRERDWVARWGGEEFVVFLPGAGESVCKEIGERIRAAVEERVKSPRQVTVSVGVSILRAGETFEQWWKRADEGLYKAKHGGRNRVESAE